MRNIPLGILIGQIIETLKDMGVDNLGSDNVEYKGKVYGIRIEIEEK